MTRIKICGLTRREDAMLAVELGAHALGFIFEPTSKRYLEVEPEWLRAVPPYVFRVAVYGNAPGAFISNAFHAVQGESQSFGSTWNSDFQKIGTIRCKPELSPRQVLERAQNCDAILLDAYREGELGGTGATIDWGFAARVVELSSLPVILAGGLTPDNVQEAIEKVQPYAVDVSSGVERVAREKDPDKMRAFFAAVTKAKIR